MKFIDHLLKQNEFMTNIAEGKNVLGKRREEVGQRSRFIKTFTTPLVY